MNQKLLWCSGRVNYGNRTFFPGAAQHEVGGSEERGERRLDQVSGARVIHPRHQRFLPGFTHHLDYLGEK